jgi:Fur family ferric uptake transcriptional regulator
METDVGNVDVVAELRQRGLRATSARVAVLQTLGELGHLTAEQLHAALMPRLPTVNLSTVYRTVESLSEHDLVRHAHLSGSAPSYYLASRADHAHLVCTSCGTVKNLTGRPLHRFVFDLARSAQFSVDTSHLTVEGLCDTCQQQQQHPPELGSAPISTPTG